MTPAQRRRLTAVARGQAPADLYLRGGTLLNVYTGELYPANVAIVRERIAYVGLRDTMIRPHAQSRSTDERRRFQIADLARALEHPWAIAAGEVTRWPDAQGGRRDLLARLDLALRRGQRVEGHTAGAAGDKIAAIAAGGLTSDHEPITAREVLERARHGLGVMLRESSLRPDLVGLLDALKDAPALASRLMLTADGSMPAFIRDHGFVDHLIRTALERGVPPLDAYRMATLNPATYYGLDAHLGGLAPGRYADVCVLRDLSEPRPETVVARGRVVAEGGRLLVSVPEPPWRRVFTSAEARLAVPWRSRPADFRLPPRARYPVVRLVSAVITRLEDRALQPGDLHAALVDRGGRWVAPGVVAGFADRLEGLAATISTDFNILVLGRSPEAMARAVNRLLDRRGGGGFGGGGGNAYELPPPPGGGVTPGPGAGAPGGGGGVRGGPVAPRHPPHQPPFPPLFFFAP